MTRSIFLLLGLLVTAAAQDTPSVINPEVVDISGIDPSLLILPGEGIDFEGCFSDLDKNDIDRDGGVRQDEFLGFIQDYAKRLCLSNDELSLQQYGAFNALSCYCAAVEGQPESCCLGQNGLVDTGGALTPATRTEPQTQFLTYACITIDNTLPDSACQPLILDRGTPPPVDTIILPFGGAPQGVQEPAEEDNVWDWLKWVLIALGLLLLLLCCCCCTIRRKRLAAIAEEEERAAESAAASKSMDVEQPPEQYPVDDYATREQLIPGQDGVDAVAPVAFAAGGHGTDPDEEEGGARGGAGGAIADDDSEDGRRRRGAHNLPEDPEEEARRIRGAGRLPPPDDPDPNGPNLKPIPPKDPNPNPDWDHPGRDINFPKPPPAEHEAGFDRDIIDGGVHDPQRDPKAPFEPYKANWERLKKEAPDESDQRKRRIQTGLGEGEVWNALEETDDDDKKRGASSGGDVFDWVVSSALGVLDKSDDAGHASP